MDPDMHTMFLDTKLLNEYAQSNNEGNDSEGAS